MVAKPTSDPLYEDSATVTTCVLKSSHVLLQFLFMLKDHKNP